MLYRPQRRKYSRSEQLIFTKGGQNLIQDLSDQARKAQPKREKRDKESRAKRYNRRQH